MPPQNILSMKVICKSFPGVVALDSVDFDLAAGEVHGLVGENGAGKSTLIKILSGVYTQDSGEIILDGQEVSFAHPRDAQVLGINPVYQELNLIPHLSASENIFLNHHPAGMFGLISYREMNQKARVVLNRLGVAMDPKRLVSEMSIAQRQMVAIAHAVSLETRILILDEPTAPLTEKETESLFDVISRLKEDGVGIVYISHRLEEVFEIADRVTVLRDGQCIGTLPLDETDIDTVISMMIGRSALDLFIKKEAEIGESVLEVKNLYRHGFYKNITFSLRRGEILGLFGLAGAGRTDLARSIFGAEPHDGGEIRVDGELIKAKTPHYAINKGVSLVPEDRIKQGLVASQSVKANISLPNLSELARYGIIRRRNEVDLADRYVDRLKIRTPSINQQVMYLSGGNQQRVIIAKWLATDPKVLILDEPTKGIDIGAKAAIHALMCDLAMQGAGILMISSELPEIMGMSDRILVMHRGQITAIFNQEDASEEEIMSAATGKKHND
jgi:ribose transport system ATP-binding protein